MTHAEWHAEGVRRFGDDEMKWRFVCPSCGYVASPEDWKSVGAPESEVAFSCLGRHVSTPRQAFGELGQGPCDYAGGGLFRINPVEVQFEGDKVERFFAFAEAL